MVGLYLAAEDVLQHYYEICQYSVSGYSGGYEQKDGPILNRSTHSSRL